MIQGLFVLICCLLAVPGKHIYARDTEPVIPHEKVYINTDRDLYVAGEEMFFRFWLYNQDDYAGKQSRYAYLALRNEHGKAENITLKLDENTAAGSISLHDTLSTGMYELVGYTNWMRNLGEESFFRKNVFIANRFDEDLQFIEPLAAGDEDLNVSFNAEGDNLLYGLPGKLLINTSGRFDTSHRDIFLLDESQDTILKCRLNAHGFGTISFTPDSAATYKLYIDGSETAFELPAAREKGISLTLDRKSKVPEVLIFHRGEQQATGKLSIRHREEVLWETAFEIQDSLTNVFLPYDELPHGVLEIRAHTTDGRHHSTRYWYHKPGDYPGVNISTAKVYGRREKVRLHLDPLLGDDQSARVSISVRKKEAATDDTPSIAHQLRNKKCAHDLNVSEYFAARKMGGIDDGLLNDLLIGFSSWDEDQYGKSDQHIPEHTLLMETDGLILSGQVLDRSGNTGFHNVRVLLNTPDTLVNLMYTHADEQGRFHFLLSDYHRDKELFLSVDPGTLDEEHRIHVADKFHLQKPFKGFTGRDIWQRRSFIRESQDIVGVQKTFSKEFVAEPVSRFYRFGRPPMVYNRPTATIFMDDYLPLDNLQEIARELVPVWRFRGSDDDLRTSLVCHNSGNRLPSHPAFFLDGIIIHDFTRLVHLGSREIDKVEIQNIHWAFGDMIFPGIVGIFTDTESYLDVLDGNTGYTRKVHESYRHHNVFDPPAYEETGNIEASQPDMRQLLAWEPDLDLVDGQSQTYTFYTGDLRGDFLITIEGLSDCGEAIFHTKTITVK